MSGNEQESICIRNVKANLEVKDIFVVLYELSNTKAETIENMLKYVLFIILCLPIENVRGQSYDGASNMSGRYNGVQALICQEQPLAYYTHCTAHRVNLVTQYVSEPECIRSILTIVDEIDKLYSNSIKFRNTFTYCKLKTLCPTRWIIIKIDIQNTLTYYKEIV